MILKEYDIGWGTVWPMKQLEQQLVKERLAKYYVDDSRSVIINSVWYTGEYHQQVIAELIELKPTHIFVIAMLDPPNVDLEWFSDLNCHVHGIGYYPGDGFVDYFAFFANSFFQLVEQDILLSTDKFDKAYMCLNRKPHPHRIRLYRGLETAGLLDQGIVSMGGSHAPLRLLDDDCDGQNIAPNGGKEQYGIGNDITSLGNLNNWQRHFVNIVTETIWDIEPSKFLSEKTFKPLLGLRPFLIYAPNGGVECLHSRGLESYVNDFEDITDANLCEPYNIPVFLNELCNQDATYWKMKMVALREKLLYNQQRVKDYAQQAQR